MSPTSPPSTAPKPTPSAPPPAGKKSRWLLYGCGGVLALLLVIVATVAITIWWIQRPIKPVVLSAQEKAVVDEKLQHFGGGNTPSGTRENPVSSSIHTVPVNTNSEANSIQDKTYVAGSKVLKLTEREINGLLNANTDLGNSLRLEFDKDAVNAYLVVPIPKDFPVGGGKMFRGRGRFALSVSSEGEPYAILEDVTVFGLSLPKAWLGGLKGQNLLGDAAGRRDGKPILKGIKSLHVESGALVLEVED